MGRQKSVLTILKENYIVNKDSKYNQNNNNSYLIFHKEKNGNVMSGPLFLCEIIETPTKTYFIKPHHLISRKNIPINKDNVIVNIDTYLDSLHVTETDYYHPYWRKGVTENYLIDKFMKHLGFKRGGGTDEYIFENISITVPNFNTYGRKTDSVKNEVEMYVKGNLYAQKHDGTYDGVIKAINNILYINISANAVQYSNVLNKLTFYGDPITHKQIIGLTIIDEDILEENIKTLEEALNMLKSQRK